MTKFSIEQRMQNYFAFKYALKERLNMLTRDEYRSALRDLPQAPDKPENFLSLYEY
jgi:hypothetical protein